MAKESCSLHGSHGEKKIKKEERGGEKKGGEEERAGEKTNLSRAQPQ